MSSFMRLTKNPVTGEYEEAYWIDDYFGRHRYGVKFPDGTIYRQSDYEWQFADDKSPAEPPPPPAKTLYCNFCGKNSHEVKLIAGPSVFICYECVDLCHDIRRQKEQPDTDNPEKYRVTYPSIIVVTNYRDFATMEEALRFDNEWRKEDSDFIRRHQQSNAQSIITKVTERKA